MYGLLDLDCVKYSVASVGEKKSIKVVNKITNQENDFKTRTEFHGRTKKKDGGWLANYNAINDTSFTVDDYDIEDVVVLEPIENVLHTAKKQVEAIIRSSGVTGWEGVIGKGKSMRVEKSTLLEYKGQRPPTPHYLNDVVEYLEKKYSPTIVTEIESDDWLVMNAMGKKDTVVIGIDKDMYSSPIKFFNADYPKEGIIDCNGFGKLWIDSTTNKVPKVRGYGRLFKYLQISYGDGVDHYKTNCFSDIPWADKSAFGSLVNCKNDKEAFTEMVKIFKYLYPEPKTVVGWRGDEINIDWLYVFSEMMNMAHLHRWENDWLDVKSILDKLGVEY